MALIKCYECGAMISDKALDCPKCGAPISQDTVVNEEKIDGLVALVREHYSQKNR